MKLRTEVGLVPGHIVLDGNPDPPTKGNSHQLSAHVCCGRTAGWINEPLGTEVGLGPGDIVLHGDPAHPSPKKGVTAAPYIRHMHCGHIVLDGNPAPPPTRAEPPIFGPCLLWLNG